MKDRRNLHVEALNNASGLCPQNYLVWRDFVRVLDFIKKEIHAGDDSSKASNEDIDQWAEKALNKLNLNDKDVSLSISETKHFQDVKCAYVVL